MLGWGKQNRACRVMGCKKPSKREPNLIQRTTTIDHKNKEVETDATGGYVYYPFSTILRHLVDFGAI